jgi:acyl dehydratase
MFDRSVIGHQFPPYQVPIEAGRIRQFAEAVGETADVYSDEVAARRAGYPSLLAPPTFLTVCDLCSPTPLPVVEFLHIDLRRLLHGEQSFTYFASICAGDVISVEQTIVDIFSKKNGALDFAVYETNYVNQRNVTVATASTTLIVRN